MRADTPGFFSQLTEAQKAAPSGMLTALYSPARRWLGRGLGPVFLTLVSTNVLGFLVGKI